MHTDDCDYKTIASQLPHCNSCRVHSIRSNCSGVYKTNRRDWIHNAILYFSIHSNKYRIKLFKTEKYGNCRMTNGENMVLIKIIRQHNWNKCRFDTILSLTTVKSDHLPLWKKTASRPCLLKCGGDDKIICFIDWFSIITAIYTLIYASSII